ncbi:uncharacterized protein BX664DRAFT_357533 [Halteromyces radiatus]|uniref:uncharacterized protein n=1 Tax=Halteromyces radiatus TaxID=101107 RepID=UPI00221F24C0|nr:uncharacterized protein BX664DRAFT_357533 [Halteromyces radiatus]KAI8093056.1 hypothetical protein BX664DRAFT_357533 [Halteromyces radiatus]
MNMDDSSPTVEFYQKARCTCDNRKESHGSQEADIWKYAVEQVKKEMFSSTSIAVPSPSDYLYEHYNPSRERCDYCKSYASSFKFNSDPFGPIDAFNYRRQRSNHLVFRLIHMLDLRETNFLRISDGVFVLQQTESQQHHPMAREQQQQKQQLSERIDSFLNDASSLSPYIEDISSSIFTFNYNDMPGLISNNSTMTTSASSSFIPYSYTLGVRYSNIGNEKVDMMIRGNIPLWCQTFLLYEFYKASPPVKANETRTGLIPFAIEIPVTFRSMIDKNDNVEDPELLLWYERLAMDTSDHELYGRNKIFTVEYENARLDILERMVLCDISNDQAAIITALAKEWAREQGFNLT